MAAQLPELPPIKQLSPSIWRILGGNPSKFTLQGTNTYLLGSGTRRILIDSAQGFPAWTQNLKHAIQQIGDVEITDCILTHWHLDHVLGVSDLLSLFPNCRVWKHQGNKYDPDGNLTQHPVRELHDGQVFSTGSDEHEDHFSVKAIHTPGHAADHIALQIVSSPTATEVGSMFTADNVLGHGTAVFEDLAVYIASLHKMLDLLEASTNSPPQSAPKAYSAHGEVVDDGPAKLKEYIAHRAMRETEATNVLLYGTPQATESSEVTAGGKAWTSMEMVKVIYAQYPASLHGPAEGGLVQVLRKLEGEGKVEQTDGRWRATQAAQHAVAASGTDAGKGGGRL